jgi:hypothetical protein
MAGILRSLVKNDLQLATSQKNIGEWPSSRNGALSFLDRKPVVSEIEPSKIQMLSDSPYPFTPYDLPYDPIRPRQHVRRDRLTILDFGYFGMAQHRFSILDCSVIG